MNDTRTPSIWFEEAAPEVESPAPPPPAPSYKPDDDMIAKELTPTLAGKLAFFHSQWKMYERGAWRGRDQYETRRYIRQQLADPEAGWRQRGVQVNQGKIRAVAAMLEDELYLPDRQIMEQQREQAKYINLRNGLFNLETYQLEDHRPDLYFTTQMDFDYDPDAYSSTFRRYLNSSLVLPGTKETDWHLVDRVIEMLAYCVTARTDLKASFWLVGGKDTGKSTMITLIKSLMGDLHTTLDLTQLGINRFLLAGMVGKRVVTFTEGDTNAILPDALYKALTGGSDEIFADVKNREPIVFRPEAKIVWAMNNMPRMADRTGATARRIVMIPFNRTIPEDERLGNLEQLLISERSGIFNALMDALQALNKRGWFAPCEQSDQMLQDYVMDNDTEAAFVEDSCERHESYKLRGKALYDAYAAWCIANGFKAKNSKQVAKEWRRLGFEQHTSAGSWWHGLRLRQNFE